MTLLVTYIALAIGVSFLCSIMEAALLSVTPAYVALQEQKGSRAGLRLHRLKEDIDRPLAAILSLNTIAHTVGAAGAGAQAAVVFGEVWVGLFSGVLTLGILFLSEIIPKTLGALYWQRLAPAVAWLLVGMIRLLWPLVVTSQGLTRLMTRGRRNVDVSREELSALAELGVRQGVIESDESRILKNLLRFTSLKVSDVMTPRPVVYSLSRNSTVGEVIEPVSDRPFSRLPVTGESNEDVTGYALKHDILLEAARDRDDTRLEQLSRPLLVVPDSLALAGLLERMLAQSEQIALVVDEYGDMKGIATTEDLVETLLGLEIVDENDSYEDMQALARRQWEVRARRLGLPVEEYRRQSKEDPE